MLGRNRSIENEFDEQRRQYEIESARAREDKQDYLRSTSAIPATAGLYALWMYAHLQQGGEVSHHSEYNFSTFDSPFFTANFTIKEGVVDGEVDEQEGRDLDNPYDHPFVTWVPTVNGGRTIPTAHGANSMDLLVLPDLGNVPLRSTSGDGRQGWEYGHTTVMTLQLDRSAVGVIAGTNQPGSVRSYADIDAMVWKAQQERTNAHDVLASFVSRRVQTGNGLSALPSGE